MPILQIRYQNGIKMKKNLKTKADKNWNNIYTVNKNNSQLKP